ncbi:UDP-N-acetylglucosamine 2-epimerase (non-hydrolyzing) [Chitinophaga pollutisoli]|uniref:UDP-N-acetylglucosamine 2-epimerase (Non-hydrolyzing) n=1 Tax=Chitinophaga pollutisoli TaxID=3133966 RepID=A0ABZ2YUX9_9BACT
MRILTVVGARPQFVKAAAVSRALLKNEKIKEIIVHTGQHFDNNMSDVFFQEMDIPRPDYNLQIHSGSHGAMTGRMMEGLEEIMLKEKPDYILIYGDTNSTLAGAITASKIHIPIAHVESGLRSFNLRMPEEVNRILADRLSSFLFCPTSQAIDNLKREGYDNFGGKIVFTGDVMFDAALYYTQKSEETSKILDTLALKDRPFILATIHRAENTDDAQNLSAIFNAFADLARECPVVLPLHPRTRKLIQSHNIPTTGVTLIDPVGYFDMLQLIRNSMLVITDSGGLQKEAYFFGKPCITTRNETEWTELVTHGYNILTGADSRKILEAFQQMRDKQITSDDNLYGKGDASDKIAQALLQ